MSSASSVISRLGAAAAGALALAACGDSLPTVPARDIAYSVLAIQPNAASGGYSLRPTSLFFSTNQLELLESAKATNQCIERVFVPRSAAISDTFPTVEYLDAGSTITLQTGGGTTATLVETVDPYGKTYYAPSGNAPVTPFTPGEVVTLTIPGGTGGGDGVFPGLTLSQTTVTPFTFDTVATKSNDPDGLKITWSAPPAPGAGVARTGMLVSLRYAAFGTGTVPDHETFCTLVDDGSHVIPLEAVGGWFRSLPNAHQTVFTRWRGEVKQLAQNRFSTTVSTIVETKPTGPTP